VFKAHRLCVSLNSRLESNKEEECEGLGGLSTMGPPPREGAAVEGAGFHAKTDSSMFSKY